MFPTSFPIQYVVDRCVCDVEQHLNDKILTDDSSDTKSVSHKKAFTWVLHAVVTSSEKEGPDQSFTFESCFPVIADLKIPEEIKTRRGRAPALVEVIQLGVSHR